jgi:hypothetical protein
LTTGYIPLRPVRRELAAFFAPVFGAALPDWRGLLVKGASAGSLRVIAVGGSGVRTSGMNLGLRNAMTASYRLWAEITTVDIMGGLA